jgi:hypothetical protein
MFSIKYNQPAGHLALLSWLCLGRCLHHELCHVHDDNKTLDAFPTVLLHLRDCVAVAQRVLNDAQARAIQEAGIDNGEKIELMGHHLFGDKWQGREIPVPEPPVPPPTANEQPSADANPGKPKQSQA